MTVAGITPAAPDLIQPRQLRWYQTEAVEAVFEDWNAGIFRVGVSMPTGTGKSSIIAGVAVPCYEMGYRILLLAHRAELLDQMRDNILAVAPWIPLSDIGIVRGIHDNHDAPIVLATLQTLASDKRRKALGQRDVILWDEVHHAPAKGYHATFTDLGGYDDALMCGFTATMYRADTTKGQVKGIGLGDVIQKISYERDLKWAIENGFLVMPQGLTVRIGELDALNKIKSIGGDFKQDDLAEIMEAAVEYTVDAIEMHARDRRSIVFAASVEACKQIVEMVNERGNLRAGLAIGEMVYEERGPIYEQFRKGEINMLVTVAVLSEGADFPMCDCVVMARPTRSRIMYSQMVGRALRLFEDPVTGEAKQDALVMDLTGAVRKMKLIHLSELLHGVGFADEEIDNTEVDAEGELILCEATGKPVGECDCEDCREPISDVSVKIKVAREGVVDMVTIDLLDQDDTLWLETPRGVPFIPLRNGWIAFVMPLKGDRDSGQWAVGCISSKETVPGPDGKRYPKGNWAEVDTDTGQPVYYPLPTALKRAREWTINAGHRLPSKYEPWRTRNQAPTDMQLNVARHMGIPSYQGMTRGRVSDEISIATAARVLDATMPEPKAVTE